MAMQGHNHRDERAQFLEDPTLYELIRNERWNEAWSLVESDPTAPYNARLFRAGSEVSWSFPLHNLCLMVRPIAEERERNEEIYKLARFMIQQSHTIQTPIVHREPGHLPGSVTVTSHRSILTLRDDGDRTPLFELLQDTCDPNMIQILLDGALSSPGLSEQMQTSTDSAGATPLHLVSDVSEGDCSFTTLQLMMQFFSGNRLTRDIDGDLPLHWAFLSAQLPSPRGLRLWIEGCHESLLVRNDDGLLPLEIMEEHHFSEWDGMNEVDRRSHWNRLEPILRAVMESVESSNDALPTIHAIASGLSFIPTKFLQIALEFINNSTAYDRDGMIPLHVAVSKPPAEESIDMFTDSVQLLITETTVGMPTQSGRLSLHLAAESNQPEVVVSELARVAPRSLSAIDPVSQLIPFQLAAAEDNNSLTNVYSLLRMDPSLL